MDFLDKKEKLVLKIREFMDDSSKKDELLALIQYLKEDEEFKSRELFLKLFYDFENYLAEFSNMDLKQRIKMIESYMDA